MSSLSCRVPCTVFRPADGTWHIPTERSGTYRPPLCRRYMYVPSTVMKCILGDSNPVAPGGIATWYHTAEPPMYVQPSSHLLQYINSIESSGKVGLVVLTSVISMQAAGVTADCRVTTECGDCADCRLQTTVQKATDITTLTRL